MHLRSSFRRLRIGRGGCVPFLVATLVVAAPTSSGFAAPAAKRAPASGNTRFLVFNGAPGGSYEVRKNGSLLTSPTAAPSGLIAFSDISQVADAYQITLTGINPSPPSPPANLSAAGRDDGCAALSWDTPPPGDYVNSYLLQWGVTSGAYTDSMVVNGTDVSRVGNRSRTVACGFAAGRYYFVLRARNEFGLSSGLSGEAVADITTGTVQPPAPPTNVAGSEPSWGCARITWNAVGNPSLTGYRLFYGAASRVYTDSLDTGLETSVEVCGFPAGRYYFALKSITSLGETSAYSQEAALTLAGVDDAPPVITGTMPADGAIGVVRNTMIHFAVTDAKAGVDPASVSVTVDGQTPASVISFGGPVDYVVQCVMGSVLSPDADIPVSVQIADLASPPNVLNFSWSFRTGGGTLTDATPPQIAAVSPAAGATRVKVDAAVVVSIGDAGLGVDLGSVRLFVNDAPVTYSVEGDPNALVIRYTPTGGFAHGTSVAVRVEACDLATPANCAAPLVYTFSLESNRLAALPDGAIVPDGFWAGEPRRPLEVRNLPARWTVRIFDTAGATVRRYTNDSSDGTNWTWDFANGNGQPVARALYLVRVTDERGALRQSGRFLVQFDP